MRFIAAFLFVLLVTTATAALVSPVNAVVDPRVCNDAKLQDSDFCKNVATEEAAGDRIVGPNGILTRIAQVIVYITGAASLIMIIIGGFRYVVSGGDSNATKGAKDTIMYAVIGLVVAIFAQVIVSLVLSKL